MDKETIVKEVLALQEEAKILKEKAEQKAFFLLGKYPDYDHVILDIIKGIELEIDNLFDLNCSMLEHFFSFRDINESFEDFNNYVKILNKIKHYSLLEDTEKIHFKGDLLITDPCYFIKRGKFVYPPKKISDFGITNEEYDLYLYKGIRTGKIENYLSYYDQWIQKYGDDDSKSNGGYQLDKLGFSKFLTKNTIYGDWSCSVFNMDTKEIIGEFCADGSKVCVCLFDDVIKYNPGFSIEPYAATIIKDFDGDVQIKVDRKQWTCDEDDEFNKKGDVIIEYNVHVVGIGNVNFTSKQTGF